MAADFFDVDPKPVDRENYNILSTTAGTCQEVLNRDMPMVDAGQLLANEEQAYRAKSEKPQELASQLSIWGGPPRSAEDETAVNSAPSPALGHRFRKTFGPVAFVDENGTVIDESNH